MLNFHMLKIRKTPGAAGGGGRLPWLPVNDFTSTTLSLLTAKSLIPSPPLCRGSFVSPSYCPFVAGDNGFRRPLRFSCSRMSVVCYSVYCSFPYPSKITKRRSFGFHFSKFEMMSFSLLVLWCI